ncbi:hypothetical protein RYX56_03715 [Alkalihalophilus lindianensis]|uniref:Uncharacterized protein n=2 Tax=Alkalihalophilus lindianensis TaxID=1630542 RepID=A0ABU3X859_9BACI|nr:hypothetical protein [Alkalihalophilus lindianensis]
MNMPKAIEQSSFQQLKQCQMELIREGCTSVITYAKTEYERQIATSLKIKKHLMINSTLDYLIGLTIPLSLLRPTVIRECKRQKIPILEVKIDSLDALRLVPWDHISQMMVTYPVVLVPRLETDDKKIAKQIVNLWTFYCIQYRIQTEDSPGNSSWSKEALQKIGLYPKKGDLLVSSDFDYQLYLHKQTEENKAFFLDENKKLDYDKREPEIVALRDRIIKVNQKIDFNPGYGRQLVISTPKRFLTIDAAGKAIY